MKAFEEENTETRFFLTGHRINVYFDNWKLASKCDEKIHKDCDTEYEVKRQKQLKKSLVVMQI